MGRCSCADHAMRLLCRNPRESALEAGAAEAELTETIHVAALLRAENHARQALSGALSGDLPFHEPMVNFGIGTATRVGRTAMRLSLRPPTSGAVTARRIGTMRRE
jgi:hypothetical protein